MRRDILHHPSYILSQARTSFGNLGFLVSELRQQFITFALTITLSFFA